MAMAGEAIGATRDAAADHGSRGPSLHGMRRVWGALPHRKRIWASIGRVGKIHRFRILPVWGEVQAAVPDDDPKMLDHFIRNGRAHPWLPPGLPGRVTKLLRWLPDAPAFRRRYGLLVAGPEIRISGQPPEYICAIARRSGVSLAGYRWGLSLPHAYSSRKIIFRLTGPNHPSQSYIIKIVSDPSLNGRLNNELRALLRLQEWGMANGEIVPRVAFSGEHAGVAILGQSLVEGAPFENKSRGGTSCPHASAALEYLLQLGNVSRQATVANGTEVAIGVGRLLTMFAEIYKDAELVAFLQDMVEKLRSCTAPIPVVFQHGDPGVWNLLVTPTGKVGFLDWEAAEPTGLPLWDVFHFLRSYGVMSSRRRGIRGTLPAFESAFLAESEMARWGRQVIDDYSRSVAVPRQALEPLFYACWMHRSVKEAARLEAGNRDRGHYLNLMRLCIRERSRHFTRRLLSLPE